jgi:hypothetical protein
MEDKVTQERVLAFNLATEITPEEMEQVSGGTQGVGTRTPTHQTTMGGGDQTYDSDPD